MKDPFYFDPKYHAHLKCADCGLHFTMARPICCSGHEQEDGSIAPPRCPHCCCGPDSEDADVLN